MRTLTHHSPATASWTAVCALCALTVELLHVVGI
jgi:hypothetical protein